MQYLQWLEFITRASLCGSLVVKFTASDASSQNATHRYSLVMSRLGDIQQFSGRMQYVSVLQIDLAIGEVVWKTSVVTVTMDRLQVFPESCANMTPTF